MAGLNSKKRNRIKTSSGANIKLEAYAFRLLGQKNIKKRATDLMTSFEHVRKVE